MNKTVKRTDIPKDKIKNNVKNKINKKQKFKTIVIPLIFFIVIISVIIVACVSCAGRGNTHNTTIPTTSVNINDYISDEEYLKINATDCTLYVGDMVKLTCSSYPESYSLGVNWRSSDTSVLTVTYDGMVTAMSTGMAAITATNGVLSHSIIIQVINEDESVPEDFPTFNPETPTVIPNETTSGNNEATGTQEPSKEPQNPTQENTSAYEETTAAVEVESTTVMEQQTTTPQETTSVEEITTEHNEETSEEIPEETTIDAREYILYSLPEFGFTNYINDTFVYKEDGNYLGQAIVEQDFTQIYVMTRTTGFDGKIKEFLKSFFPKGYATVFNKFITATYDTTFYADGYKVRVITSPSGGHRQLIIYY